MGPDFAGALGGSIIGAWGGGGWNGAFHGATVGMMVGSLSAAGAKGLWGVQRAKVSAGAAGLAISRGQYLRQKYGYIASNERMKRIGVLVDANAVQYLQRLEAMNSGAHFLSRHGADLSLDDLAFRAMSGLRPDDGALGPIVDSSKFLTNVSQMHSIDRAISLYQLGVNKPIVTFEYAIGEGFQKMFKKIDGKQIAVPYGPHYFQSNSAQVYFRNDLPYTAFPMR